MRPGTAKHEISADETNFLASIHILLHERKRKKISLRVGNNKQYKTENKTR
jgi:hypothetical protein